MPPDALKELGEAIVRVAGQHAARAVAGVPCELGKMTATGLKLDKFKHEIQDPLVAEWVFTIEIRKDLFIPQHDETGTIVLPGYYSGEAQYHFDDTTIVIRDDQGNVVRSDIRAREAKCMFRPELKPGDRVLAVPVNGGKDAVILAKVVPYNA